MVCIRVVVAARALEAGTKLSVSDVEVVQIHTGAVQEGAFETVEDVIGLITTVQRLPGDQVTSAMVGDSAQNALAQALDPDHRAVAIDVDRASGLAGLLRPGDTVSAIGIIEQELTGIGETNTGAESKIMLTGLKVLFVPYEFRYRELNTGSEGDAMSPVMASSADRDNGVIVLSVPVEPITVTWDVVAETPVAAANPAVDADTDHPKVREVFVGPHVNYAEIAQKVYSAAVTESRRMNSTSVTENVFKQTCYANAF